MSKACERTNPMPKREPTITDLQKRVDRLSAGKRGKGRPRGIRYVVMHVSLDQRTRALLRKQAEAAGLNESAYIRQLIEEHDAYRAMIGE